MDIFFFCPVLKVVENLGVSYVRSSDAYKTKLEAELRKLKFPYRVSKDQDMEFSWTLFFFYIIQEQQIKVEVMKCCSVILSEV